MLIECGGLVLVLVLDSAEGDWLMGQQTDDSAVLCWRSYGEDLNRADVAVSHPFPNNAGRVGAQLEAAFERQALSAGRSRARA